MKASRLLALCRLLAFCAVSILVGSLLHSPVKCQPIEPDKLVRIVADTEMGAGNEQQLFGHVQFEQGTLHGSSDKAIRYLDRNMTELIGHVVIRQDTLLLMAPHATWEGNTRIGHADGNIMLMDRDVTLTAVQGDYDSQNQIAYFQKHVTITEGKDKSVSDSLIYYRATETSDSRGHVVAESDSGTLKANRVLYSRALDETTAFGDADLRNDSLILDADWMFNAKRQGLLFARGHVMLNSIKDRTIIYGDTLARFAKLGEMDVPINPLLLMIDSSRTKDSLDHDITKFDTLFIKSMKMYAWQGDSERYIAEDSVRLMRADFRAVGGKLYYSDAADLMTLSEAKRIRLWNDSTEIDADSVAMLLNHRRLKQINAVGHAFATSPLLELPNSGRMDQLQGEAMQMFMAKDTLRDILVISNALSIYFLIDGLKPNGLNRSSGDTIRIDMEKKQVRRVTVLSGAEGEFFPERYVGSRAKDFRLSGYERNPQLRPQRQEFDIPRAAKTLAPPIPGKNGKDRPSGEKSDRPQKHTEIKMP